MTAAGAGGRGEPTGLHSAALILGVVAAASAAIFTRYTQAPPLAIAFWRLAMTAALLLLPLVVQQRRHRTPLTRRDLLLAVAGGAFLGIHFGAWVTSLFLTTVAASTVLVSTHPFFVMAVGAWLFGERAPRMAVLGAVLATAGGVLLGWGDFRQGGSAVMGDLLALIGALAFGGYILVGRSVRQRTGVLAYAVLCYGTAAMGLLAAAVAFGDPLLGFPPQTWLLFFSLAVVPTLLGHTVFNWLLRYVKAAVVSVGILGEPVGATLLAWALLGELPSQFGLIGGALILLGIGISVPAMDRAT